MATNSNLEIVARSAKTPAKYLRSFARRFWKSNFPNGISFSSDRQAQREGSFRHFTGRTVNP